MVPTASAVNARLARGAAEIYIAEVIADRSVNTLRLAGLTALLAVPLALVLGLLAATFLTLDDLAPNRIHAEKTSKPARIIPSMHVIIRRKIRLLLPLIWRPGERSTTGTPSLTDVVNRGVFVFLPPTAVL